MFVLFTFADKIHFVSIVELIVVKHALQLKGNIDNLIVVLFLKECQLRHVVLYYFRLLTSQHDIFILNC